MTKKKCPTCGRDMHYGYGGWLCGFCAYEPEDKFIGGTCEDCKYYSNGVLGAGNGNCSKGIDIRGNGTPSDFGCVMWKNRE